MEEREREVKRTTVRRPEPVHIAQRQGARALRPLQARPPTPFRHACCCACQFVCQLIRWCMVTLTPWWSYHDIARVVLLLISSSHHDSTMGCGPWERLMLSWGQGRSRKCVGRCGIVALTSKGPPNIRRLWPICMLHAHTSHGLLCCIRLQCTGGTDLGCENKTKSSTRVGSRLKQPEPEVNLASRSKGPPLAGERDFRAASCLRVPNNPYLVPRTIALSCTSHVILRSGVCAYCTHT